MRQNSELRSQNTGVKMETEYSSRPEWLSCPNKDPERCISCTQWDECELREPGNPVGVAILLALITVGAALIILL